jgi:hypothetical protein
VGGRARLSALLATVALLAAAPAAHADSLLVPNINWTALLPPAGGTTAEVQPGPVPTCETPSIACIDITIERLRRCATSSAAITAECSRQRTSS